MKYIQQKKFIKINIKYLLKLLKYYVKKSVGENINQNCFFLNGIDK